MIYFDLCWFIKFNGKKPKENISNRDKTACFFSLKNCLKFMDFSKLPCSSATMLLRFLQLCLRVYQAYSKPTIQKLPSDQVPELEKHSKLTKTKYEDILF